MRTKNQPSADPRPWRLLLWAALAGLVFGLAGFGELIEDQLRMTRNALHPHKASGDIVLVSIDNHSLREVGRWPWPRRRHAELVDRLSEAGAKRIFFDVQFETRSDPVDDQLLSAALRRSGRVVLPVRGETGPNGLSQPGTGPIPMLNRHAELGSIQVRYNYQNAVWNLPYAVDDRGKQIPSYAAKLAGVQAEAGSFTPDYSVALESIPSIGAEKVLAGRFDPSSLTGKDVIIGTNSEAVGDQYFVPGVGKVGGVYVHIIGAETLKAGRPVGISWIPAFVLAFALCCLAVLRLPPQGQRSAFATIIAALVVAPVALDAQLVFVQTAPALFVTLTIWSVLGWRAMRRRGLVNPLSGLPNLDALRANRAGRDQAIIATRVLNYEEALATLPADSERELVRQIVSRLRVGDPNRVLYQGDGGIFAWFEEARRPVGNHIDALHGLFRNPARVGGQPIDLSVAFGVEIGSSRSLSSRLASALVAAEEAAHEGLKRKYHDPESLQSASWRLSLLSQLDAAIDKGEVWISYQPKLELATRRIVGAEALARWTHPEKGPIAASEFIAAAEQHDRIGKLTDFVLDSAMAAAATLDRRQEGFGVAVNLSARLLTDQGFALRLAAMLARHRLRPEQLTLELTETAELAASGTAIDILSAIRSSGVAISIDDYGTGLSTLDYLKKIPACEIKIDQSFVKGMLDNRSDRLMVQSTIGLAHSLGRRVVAEGVEHRDTLEALAEMECDFAQGFIVGRPMSLESLIRRLPARQVRVA